MHQCTKCRENVPYIMAFYKVLFMFSREDEMVYVSKLKTQTNLVLLDPPWSLLLVGVSSLLLRTTWRYMGLQWTEPAENYGFHLLLLWVLHTVPIIICMMASAGLGSDLNHVKCN